MGKKLVETAGDGDAGLAEDVCDLCDAEARSVIFKRKMEFGIVELEATKSIGVGKFAERAELVVGERRLEFEFGFEERHAVIIAKTGMGEGERETGGQELALPARLKRGFIAQNARDERKFSTA